MIKAPSNQKPYEVFFSGDPAIVSLPDEASEEQHKELARRIKRALQTGDWSDVIVPGEQPTRFVLRPLSAEVTGELYAMLRDAKSERDRFAVWTLAFRCAVVDVKNLPDAGEIDFVVHPQFGRIATTKFLDRAGLQGDVGAAIITELGVHAITKARGDDPL